MNCGHCKGGVTEREAVTINGTLYHVGCFGAGLHAALAPVRAALATLDEFELRIGDKVTAEQATAAIANAFQMGRGSGELVDAVKKRRRRRRGAP